MQARIRIREVLIIGHLGDMVRMQFLKEARGFRDMEFRIFGFDANKETV
jgi:hypothetical protein